MLGASLTLAMPCAAQSPPADSAIIALTRAARDGPLKLAALRSLPLDNPQTFAVTLPVPDSWSCRMYLDERLVTVRCDILVPKGTAQAEYERLEQLLFEHADRRAWAKDARTAEEMVRRSTGMERAVAYVYRRQRRVIARTNLSIGTGAVNARVPPGSDRIIILSVRSRVHEGDDAPYSPERSSQSSGLAGRAACASVLRQELKPLQSAARGERLGARHCTQPAARTV